MDIQEADCGEPHDSDDGDKDPSSSVKADDRSSCDPSCVTETSGSDQPHTTEDQEETTVKMSEKLFIQSGDASKSYDDMDLSPIRFPTLDPLLHFSNSSIVSGSENRNTHRKTGADMRILATYMRSLNELRTPETIPPAELDKYLSSFFLVVRKTDGSEYEPCSLRAMLASIERYLRQMNYPASLTRDNEFSNMRNVLKLKQQMLRSLGKGQKTVAEISQTACAREGKITRLFHSHEMGPYNPNSVIFSLCFFFCMYLKLRKSTEHKKLLWGDIILCQDYNNREYLTFSPQMLSRIHASQRLNHRLANARVWAEPEIPDRDPVALYKLYAQKRPMSMHEVYAPFYLGINLLNPVCGQSWYRPSAMGINKLNEMVRQIRDLTGLKTSSDTSPLQYLASGSQDSLPLVSEVSNASSDPSSTRNGQLVDGSDFDGRETTPNGSPQLTIDVDESGMEPINATTSFMNALRESDSSDEASPKSTITEKGQGKDMSSLSFSAFRRSADAGDMFQHQVATMNVARAREMMTQSSEEQDDEDDADDFISVEQAKELVTDIVQRMDIMDMVQFDRWLKSMTITRDAFSGQVVCKDPKKEAGSGSAYPRPQDPAASNDDPGSEHTSMNILLNIALTPSALRGKGPVTVQATTVSAADLQALSAFPSASSTADRPAFSSCWNGRQAGRDSPLDLALSSSMRGASESHNSSRVSSSSSASQKHSASSSLAGAAAGECSSTKRGRLSNDAAYHHPLPYAQGAAVQHGGAAVVTGPKRSPGQYEGSRRKLNPAFLTHIKPRTADDDHSGGVRSHRRVVMSSADLDDGLALTHTSSVEDDDLVHVLNLKQEVE